MGYTLFHEFQRDRITVSTPDGSVVAFEVAANVGRGKISVLDTSIPIEVGYVITRTLPSGVVEEYEVEDPGFRQAFDEIPARYAMKVSNRKAPRSHQPIHVNATGPNSRINIGSHDASFNLVQDAGTNETFASLANTLRDGVANEVERRSLLNQVEQMQSALGTPTFPERYRAFLESAARYMTILGPFLVPLGQMLTQLH